MNEWMNSILHVTTNLSFTVTKILKLNWGDLAQRRAFTCLLCEEGGG